MSGKTFKIPQLSFISEQTDSTIYRKRQTTQFNRGFFKQLPLITRFQNSKDASQQSSKFSSKRIRTEQIARSKRQLSPSDRQISRFIYKHLHKKIAFQQKIYGDLEINSQIKSTPEIMDSVDTNQRQNMAGAFGALSKSKPHIYGYQKTNGLDSKSFQIKRQVASLRQRMPKSHCQRFNMVNISLAKRQYNKKTHIDAYFDLSCLQKVKQPQENNFLLTNSQQPY